MRGIPDDELRREALEQAMRFWLSGPRNDNEVLRTAEKFAEFLIHGVTPSK